MFVGRCSLVVARTANHEPRTTIQRLAPSRVTGYNHPVRRDGTAAVPVPFLYINPGVSRVFAVPARYPRARRRNGIWRYRCRRGGQFGRRGGVQHRHDRLPGNSYRPILLPSDRHADLSAYRQHRRQPGRSGVGSGVCRRSGHPRSALAPIEFPQRAKPVRTISKPTKSSPSPASTRASSRACCAPRARNRAACSPPRRAQA